jgi:hypothetical protein
MQSSLRTLFVLAVLLAAPISVSAGQNLDAPASYTPGDIITITVTGDSESRQSTAISALLTIDADLTLVNVELGALNRSTGFNEDWIHTGTSGTCGTIGLASNECLAVDAFGEYGFETIDLLTSTLTTWQFDTTNATGNLLFLLEPRAPAGFFGLPGTQATVVMIPEPAPVVLLCAGLVALTARRRRHSGAAALRR